MRKRTLTGMICSIAAAELTGLLAFWLSGNIGDIYAYLYKPPLSPPGWLFGVIWPLLYALMGIAVYIVCSEHAPAPIRGRAVLLYVCNLVLNVLWCVVFFRWNRFWLALLVLLLLDFVVVLLVRQFAQVDASAAGLLLPYLIWIFFATYLNLGVAILNH